MKGFGGLRQGEYGDAYYINSKTKLREPAIWDENSKSFKRQTFEKIEINLDEFNNDLNTDSTTTE